MVKVSRTKISILTLIISALMATSTMIGSIYAAPTTVASGRGTGTLTCADGTNIPNLAFSFSVHKEKGKLSGSWNAIAPDFNSLSGGIYGGKIGKTSLTFLTTLDFFQSQICSNDPVPTKGTITAQCGQGTNIEFKFENGAHATISGNVVCHA
jgi:hypothetical protein